MAIRPILVSNHVLSYVVFINSLFFTRWGFRLYLFFHLHEIGHLLLSSSRFFASCMYRLSTKGPGPRVVIIWCIVTSRLRFHIWLTTFLNCFIIVLGGIHFSCAWHWPERSRSIGTIDFYQIGLQTSIGWCQNSQWSSTVVRRTTLGPYHFPQIQLVIWGFL